MTATTTQGEWKPARCVRITRDIFTLGLYEIWYRKTLYAIRDGHFVFQLGVLSRTEMVVPADKIVAVRTDLSPILGASSVVVDTGFGAAAVPKHLTRNQARGLADAVKALKAGATVPPATSAETHQLATV